MQTHYHNVCVRAKLVPLLNALSNKAVPRASPSMLFYVSQISCCSSYFGGLSRKRKMRKMLSYDA